MTDDYVRLTIDDGRVRRMANGIFELILQVPPEDGTVLITFISCGGVKLEISGTCLELSLRTPVLSAWRPRA